MNEYGFTVKKTDTLRNQVYKDIKSAIIRGKIDPGTRLRENDISKEMGVSRGPIREAILLLEREGLLVTQTHKETMVAKVEKDEVTMLLNPLRVLLESFSIQKIIPNLNETHFVQLEKILDELNQACKQKEIEVIVEKDLEFHEYLIALTGEPYLITLWKSVSSRIVFHFMTNTREKHQMDNFSQLMNEHKELFEAIKTKNWEYIEPVLKEHIY
ncbi:GntR family transcriptional regulator [Paenibacillus hamazuiensis]|uniref:GntR family transcriptional regulator n=1 Tax=Paenibacillus hamazuiensis TaxID=2936508 RepID=UPI00200D7BF2|nr:GntR family transcriptional regulator [Paenibacillus hamazuiensis]